MASATPLTRRAPTGTLITDVGQSTFYARDTTAASALRPGGRFANLSSSPSMDSSLHKHSTLLDSRRLAAVSDSRFPKLQDCAHFHYERVGLTRLQVSLYQGSGASFLSSDCNPDEHNKYLVVEHHNITDPALASATGVTTRWARWPSRTLYHGIDETSGDYFFTLNVSCNGKNWLIRRSLEQLRKFDRQLHTCVYDRMFSQLVALGPSPAHGHPPHPQPDALETVKIQLADYLARFSQIAGNLINCAPVLNWLELDNRGFHLVASDSSAINTPAVAAVHVVKRYVPQLGDELPLEVGDMISVIDMPAGEDSLWWRGKKELEVGFFPGDCVELISRDHIPPSTPDSRRCPTSVSHEHLPVLRKQGKFASFFRSFLSNRPTRRRLKESGILRERIFGCDLGEYLMNGSSHCAEGTGLKVPAVLIHCAAFIEQYGIVDGIYRLSGVQSNIQKLRQEFDADHIPDLALSEVYMQDIHSVASVLKLYFRELPNPLLTHQLYDKFVEAVQAPEDLRLLKIHDVVSQLPPPHYRTLEYLMRHLARIASAAGRTGMTSKNLAIVWAPNLLRSSESESSLDALKGVSVCAIAVEYLVKYAELIFSSQMQTPSLLSRSGLAGRNGRPKSLAVSNPAKLLTLDQARSAIRANPVLEVVPTFVEVGAGSQNIPEFHTVIDLPKSRGKQRRSRSVKERKTNLTWRSILPGHRHQRKQVCTERSLPLSVHAPTIHSPASPSDEARLSFSRSVESVFQPLHILHADTQSVSSCVVAEPVSAPAHLPLARCHSSPINQNRSISHESYFVRSGSLSLTRPKRIVDVVRTVRYDECEGGLLVKLSFDEAVENEMQVETGILNETLTAPKVVTAEVVAVELHRPERSSFRPISKRAHRTLSPLVLRRHRSWVDEQPKPKGPSTKATTFPRQSSGVKRSLSASPATVRPVHIERDAISLVWGNRSSDSGSSSSGRKSFRRSTAEEEADNLAGLTQDIVADATTRRSTDIEETCQEICGSYPEQMDEYGTAVNEPGAGPAHPLSGIHAVEVYPVIHTDEIVVWHDEDEEVERSPCVSPIGSCTSSSSLHSLVCMDETEHPPDERESDAPVACQFLFGDHRRSDLSRTVSVPLDSTETAVSGEGKQSVKRHSYFFGQTDPSWGSEDVGDVAARCQDEAVLEQTKDRPSYLFSQPIVHLESATQLRSCEGESGAFLSPHSSRLSETLEEIAKQLPSFVPVVVSDLSTTSVQVELCENAVDEMGTGNRISIAAEDYRWMDSSSESLIAEQGASEDKAEELAKPYRRPDSTAALMDDTCRITAVVESVSEEDSAVDKPSEDVPDTPCSVRALRYRFEQPREGEVSQKAPASSAPLPRSPTRESLKSKLDALSETYSIASPEPDAMSVSYPAPSPTPSQRSLSRKWKSHDGHSKAVVERARKASAVVEGGVFRWPPSAAGEAEVKKEESKENEAVAPVSDAPVRKGMKVSQICQIFQTPAPPGQATATSSGRVSGGRGSVSRGTGVAPASYLVPQYYSSV